GAVDVARAGPDGRLAVDPRLVGFVAPGAMPSLTSAAGDLRVAPAEPAPPACVERARALRGADVVLLRGAFGAGRTTIARALASLEDRPLLELTVRARSTSLVAAALRDARVLGARLLVRGALDDDTAADLARARDVAL